MQWRTVAKHVSIAFACGGLAALIAAAAVGQGARYFDILIVGGVDAVTIGLASYLLLLIFAGQKQPNRRMTRRERSLSESDAYELKIVLVQHLSREKAITIGFPPDDDEARGFAQQIATYLDRNSYRIVGFAAEPAPAFFKSGVGIDVDSNRVMVGPRDPVASARQ